ncbi:MAG: SCO family protein, partial [Planctomycetaceae bacterium]|nr:SCO family protein [Planctomycetaceae bacterium]
MILALLGAMPAYAVNPGMKATHGDDQLDTSLLRVDEARHLGAAVPNVTVLTADGPRELYDLIDEKPTIVQLAYYSCTHTCPMTLRNLASLGVDESSSDYQMIVLSFDVNDTVETMQAVQSTLDHVPDNWKFGLLPAEDVTRLTESVGFNFFFSERDQTFVHPAVLVFLSPQGEVMRYLYGID